MASDFRNLIVSALARRTRALSRVRAGKLSRKAGRRKFRSKFSARETTVRRVYVTPERGAHNDAADGAWVVPVRRLRTTFSGKFSICGARGAHDALRQAFFPDAGFLLANQFLPIGRSVAHDIASLPGQMGQTSGQGLMAAQAARCQNVVDFIGKPVHL